MTEAEQDPLKIFLDIFQEFLAPVGQLTIAFSIMEEALTWAIGSCLKISNDEAKAIESQILSIDARIKLFHSVGLMQTKDESLRAELKLIIGELERLNTLRNRVLHGFWNNTATGGGKESSAAKVRYTTKNGFKQHVQYVAISEIRKGARDMIYLHHRITFWGGKIIRQHRGKTS